MTKIATITEQNATSYAATGLSPNTSYDYKLRTLDRAGLDADSNPITVITLSLSASPNFTYEQKFNTLNDGALNGQDSWSGHTTFQVQGTTAYEDAKAVYRASSPGGTSMISRSFDAVQTGTVYIAMRAAQTNAGNGRSIELLDGGGTIRMRVGFKSDDMISMTYGDGAGGSVMSAIYSNYLANQWYVIGFDFDNANHPNQYRVKVHNGVSWTAWTDWYNVIGDSYPFISKVQFVKGVAGAFYWDTITPTDPTAPPGRYWVGNGGDWSDAAHHWATSPGGTPGAGNLPTFSDNVYFDADSFTSDSQTVTINGTYQAYCNKMDWTGVTHNPTFGGDSNTATLTIEGSLTLAPGTSLTYPGSIIFTGGMQNITTNGVTFTGPNLRIRGEVILQDNLSTTGTIFVGPFNGLLDTNNKSVTCGAVFLTDGAILFLRSSTITVTGGFWQTSGNMTLGDNTSTIILSGPNATFESEPSAPPLRYNKVRFTGGGAITMAPYDSTFANLTVAGTGTDSFRITGGNSFAVTGTLTLTGNSASNRLLVYGAYGSSLPAGITAAAVSLANCNFQNIRAAGAAIPWTGTNLGDAGGNSNITFTP